MQEENKALQSAYNIAKSKGYTKSINDFSSLLSTNQDALNNIYSEVQSKGYKKSLDEFSELLGVKKKDISASSIPQQSLESNSDNGSSVSQNNKVINQSNSKITKLAQDTESAKVVSNGKIKEITQSVDDEINQVGIINNTKAYAKKGFNKLIDGLLTITPLHDSERVAFKNRFGLEENPLSDELKEIKKEEQDEIALAKRENRPARTLTNEERMSKARQLKIDKRIKSESDSQVRAFMKDAEKNIDEYGVSDKDKLLIYNKSKEQSISYKDKDLLKRADLFSKVVLNTENEIKEVRNSFRNGEITKDEAQSKLDFLNRRRNSSIAEGIRNLEEFNSKDDELGTVKDNIDLLKRNYNWITNITRSVDAGVDKMASGIIDSGRWLNEIVGQDQYSADNIMFMSMSNDLKKSYQAKTESLMKPISVDDIDFDSEHLLSDFGSYASTLLGQQLPIMAAVVTGAPGISALGFSSAGEKYDEMIMEEAKGEENYSHTQKIFAPLGYGLSETGSALVDRMIMMNTSRVIRAATSLEKKEIAKGFAKNVFIKPTLHTLKSTAIEGLEEGATEIAQNLIDIYFLDKKDVDVYDNVKDAVVAGGLMGGAMSSPALVFSPYGSIRNSIERFSTEQNLRQAQNIVFKLSEALNSDNISETEFGIIKDQFDKATIKTIDIAKTEASKIAQLSNDEFNAINEIERGKKEIKSKAQEILDGELSQELKDEVLKGLKDEYTTLENQRVGILNRDSNALLNLLPQEEVIRLKDEAGRELMQEKNPDGTKKITIEDKEISERALENYRKQSLPNETVQTEDIVDDGNTRPSNEQLDSVQGELDNGKKGDNQTQEIQSTETAERPEVIKASDNGREYTVSNEEGRIVFKDRQDNLPSKRTHNRLALEYAKQTDLTEGKRAHEVEGVVDSSELANITVKEANKFIAEKSESPIEIAETILGNEIEDYRNGVDYKQKVIAENLGHVSRESFIQNSDEVHAKEGGSIPIQYLRKDGTPLDTKAKELSEIAGIEITEQDIVDFILENPTGTQTFLNNGFHSDINSLKTRFEDLTGLPATNEILQEVLNQNDVKNNRLENMTSLDFMSDEYFINLTNEIKQYEQETANRSTENISEISNSQENGRRPRVQEEGVKRYRGSEEESSRSREEQNRVRQITEHDYVLNNSITELKEKVLSLFQVAVNNKQGTQKESIAELLQSGKDVLTELSGLDFREITTIEINQSDLKHIYNDHFGKNEKDPGQNIPLTNDDIKSIPDVVLNPDKVSFLGYDERKQANKFEFKKSNGDGVLTIVHVYGNKGGRLSIKTLYNKKKGINQRPDVQASGITSENDFGASPSVANIQNNNQNNTTEQFSTYNREKGLITERIKPERRRTVSSPKKLNEIIDDVRKSLKATLIYGKTGRSNGLGSYNPSSTLVRIRKAGDLDTVAHELGHWLDDKYQILDNIPDSNIKSFKKEIDWFSDRGGSNPPSYLDLKKKERYLEREGIGEFIRAYVANPSETKIIAPNLLSHLENIVDKKDLAVLKAFSNDYLDFYNATAGEKILANIETSTLPNRTKATEWLKKFKSEDGEFTVTPWDKLNSNLFNALGIANKAFEFATNLSKDDYLTPNKNFEMLSRVFSGIDGKTEIILRDGLVDGKNEFLKDKDGNNMTINWLLDPLDNSSENIIKQEMNEVIQYLVAERTVEYAKKFDRTDNLTGIGAGIETDISIAVEHLNNFKELKTTNKEKYNRIKEAANRYRQYADAGLKYAVDKGRITKEEYDIIKENNEYYVALSRIKENAPMDEDLSFITKMTGNLTSVKDVVKKAKGGTDFIQNPYISLLQNTVALIKESDRNEVLRSFINPLSEIREMGDGTPLDFSQIARIAQQGDKNTKSIYINGVKQIWQFSPDVYKSLTGLEKIQTNSAIKIFKAPADLLRFTVTHFPVFAAKNLTRDTTSRLVVTRTNSGFKNMISSYSDFQLYSLYGGSQAGFYLSDKNAYKNELNSSIKKMASKGGIVLDPRNIWKGYKKILEKGENVNRIAEFKSAYSQALKQGLDSYNASLYAAYQARDLMDFAVAGHWIRYANMFIPFLNAGVQGVVRTKKSMTENPGSFIFRTMLYTVVPTILSRILVSLNGDDDEYEELPDYQRDLAWNFKTPFTGDTWISIPKPFEQGLFSSFVDRGISLTMGNDDAFDGFAGSSLNVLVPVDGASIAGPFKPIVEVMTNKDMFRDKYIVSPFEEGKILELRKGADKSSRVGLGTSKVFNSVGMTIDPRHVDHLIKSYTSYMGDWGLSISDIGKEDSRYTFGISKTGFAKDIPVSNAKSVTKAYELARELGVQSTKKIKKLRNKIESFYDAEDPSERKKISEEIYSYSKDLIKDFEEKKKTIKKPRG